MPRLTPKLIFEIPIYWAFFWNTVYVMCPPREKFNSPRYNKFLDIVSYYGSLNIRSLFMKLYGAQPQDAAPVPAKLDAPLVPVPPSA